MGKSKAGKTEVTDYRMSIHYGICHTADALLQILVGEKEAWLGTATTAEAISIDRSDLFGGVKKEGGVSGTAQWLPGTPSQTLPELLASKLGLTSATAPGYRGLSSLWFHGGGTGFLWGTNNPYLRSIWMKIRRSPKVLDNSLRLVGPNANPAAIIYECLTDTDWGMGGSPSMIKTSSFVTAAQQLALEGFGLSLQWTRSSEIESFISEVLDHIQATIFVNPRDGLLTIKLIRDDYDPDALPILTPDNCDITNWSRKAWGETINEIVVTWTNPENENEETVIAQNLANIVIQGAIVSDSRNYYGVRDKELATRLAYRDLALSAAPLAAFEIEVDRSAWNFVPGGCVKLVSPENGIDGLILRVVDINYGKPGEPTIKVSASEDIFAQPVSHYDDPDESAWVDPAAPPSPLDYVRLITAPAYFVSAALLAADVAMLEYPEVYVAALASSAVEDTSSYSLIGQMTLPNGTVVGEFEGTKPLLGYSTLPSSIPAEVESLVPTFGSAIGGPGARVAGFVFFGNVPEGGQEIAMIQSADGDGYVLKRGILDTVPRAWPSGTPVWFLSIDTDFIDLNNTYAASDTAIYKMLPTTSKGTLSVDEAPLAGVVLTGRPHLPNRPANVVVASTAFGSVDISATSPTVVPVSWANRNRTMEDSQVVPWNEATVTPEAGQTTTITIIRIDGTVITTHDGLTGTSFDVPIASFGDAAVADVRVTSKRDGLESLQGHRIRVKVRVFGWGDSWGEDWGGSGSGGAPGDPDPGDPGPEFEPDPGYEFPPYRQPGLGPENDLP